IGRVSRRAPLARRIDLDELQLTGNDASVAGAIGPRVLDGVLEIEQHTRGIAVIVGIDQDRSILQEVAIAFEDEIDRSVEQGVARAHERRERLPGNADEVLLEGDPLVALEDRFPDAHEAVAASDDRRHVGDLESTGLPLPDRAAEQAEGFDEEGSYEMGLEPAGCGALHVLTNAAHLA